MVRVVLRELLAFAVFGTVGAFLGLGLCLDWHEVDAYLITLWGR